MANIEEIRYWSHLENSIDDNYVMISGQLFALNQLAYLGAISMIFFGEKNNDTHYFNFSCGPNNYIFKGDEETTSKVHGIIRNEIFPKGENKEKVMI